MFFKYFSRQILFSRTFQDSPVYSSTFQACANPDLSSLVYRSLFVHIIVIANTSVDDRSVTTRKGKAPAIYLLMKAGSPEIMENSFN